MIKQQALRAKKVDESENKESMKERIEVHLSPLHNSNSNIRKPKKCCQQSDFPLHGMGLLFFHLEKFVAVNLISLLPQYTQLAFEVSVFTRVFMISGILVLIRYKF